MSLVSLKPKTIVLSARPFQSIEDVCQYARVEKRSGSDLESLIDEDVIIDDDLCGEQRKRRRLTYLSPEEKMVRRKLKNRVAAQTARDRKKQRMVELEMELAVLQAENKALQAENGELRRSSTALTEENIRLKEHLEKPKESIATRKLSDADAESAVLNAPLQQELARTAFQLAAQFIVFLAILSLTCGSSSSKKSTQSLKSVTAQSTQTKCSHLVRIAEPAVARYHNQIPFVKW